MSFKAQLHFVISEADLIRERKLTGKSEPPKSKSHHLIFGNTFAKLHAQLKNSPNTLYANMQVKVSPTGFNTSPDIVVVGSDEQFDETHKNLLLNPLIVIEVLSESTDGYSQDDKFQQYRQHDSLMEYVLIAQDKHCIEHYVRQPDSHSWLFSETESLPETVQLSSINCCLTLAEVYSQVEIAPTDDVATVAKQATKDEQQSTL